MPLLSTSEALHVSDSFLSSLYGDEIFRRWKELKDEMKFSTEREYVSWLIDVANHYTKEDESMSLQDSSTSYYVGNVKTEAIDNNDGWSHEVVPRPSKKLKTENNKRSFESSDHKYRMDGDSKWNLAPVSEDAAAAGGDALVGYNTTDTTQQQQNESAGRVGGEFVEGYYYRAHTAPDVVLSESEEETAHHHIHHEQEVGTVQGNDTCTQQQWQSDETDGPLQGGAVVDAESVSGVSVVGVGEGRRLQCPQCPYSSKRRDHITRHLTTVHQVQALHGGMVNQSEAAAACSNTTTTTAFPCEYCHYASKRKDHLTRHVQSVHHRQRPHACHYCDYRSVRRDSLQVHMAKLHGVAG